MSTKKKIFVIIGSLVLLLSALASFLFGFYERSEKLQDKLPWPIVMIVAVLVIAIACAVAESKIKKAFKQTES